MPDPSRVNSDLPPIPAKRYFTIGEVSDLCAVKPHVLRYWEQEFTQLKPVKRRGNRRYYQHHEVLLIRRIRDQGPPNGVVVHAPDGKFDIALLQQQTRVQQIGRRRSVALPNHFFDDHDGMRQFSLLMKSTSQPQLEFNVVAIPRQGIAKLFFRLLGAAELGDVVEDRSAESPFEVAATALLPEEISRLLAPLDEREREILKLRFGLDRGEPRTLEEVGEHFNLTRERIRQIEARAMSKLRHPSSDTGARDLLAV